MCAILRHLISIESNVKEAGVLHLDDETAVPTLKFRQKGIPAAEGSGTRDCTAMLRGRTLAACSRAPGWPIVF
jgi:hypothetical protein